jgi:POT family proton-dependent oligopeptide transporter
MVLPVGLALFSRAAPRRVGGLFIGFYWAHLFIANFATGKLAGLVETMDGYSFWAMHAAIVGGGAVLLVVFALLFGKLLAPEGEPTGPAPAAAARLAKAA